MKKTLMTIIVSLAPAALLAQGQTSIQCTMGDLTRRVEIMHETGVTVPCEVHYYKDTEAPGERQVLWRAMNEEGYCESKTDEFVATLTDMGWNCGMPSVPSDDDGMNDAEGMNDEMDATEMSDDTDALAPAEDIEMPEDET